MYATHVADENIYIGSGRKLFFFFFQIKLFLVAIVLGVGTTTFSSSLGKYKTTQGFLVASYQIFKHNNDIWTVKYKEFPYCGI